MQHETYFCLPNEIKTQKTENAVTKRFEIIWNKNKKKRTSFSIDIAVFAFLL